MTQTADLPQLSLQRYFDLVKRRRWQLVPVSLLGLIIGGVVAFFIPRFFVAETLLSHLSLLNHFRGLMRGVVDTRDVAYFVILSATFLALAGDDRPSATTGRLTVTPE